MTRVVTVVFDGAVFRPTEPVDLPADTEYRMTIDEANDIPDEERYPLAGLLKFTIDTGLGDLAEEHDHYLYGTPKRGQLKVHVERTE